MSQSNCNVSEERVLWGGHVMGGKHKITTAPSLLEASMTSSLTTQPNFHT